MRWCWCGLLLTLMVAGCQGNQLADLLIRNVNVVDVQEGSVLEDRSVYIRGNRIAKINNSSGSPSPEPARVVDAGGKYLIPGLWDMHSHTWNAENTRNTVFPLNLAYGVIGIRNMAGDCSGDSLACAGRATFEEIEAMRQDIKKGTLSGPRIHNATTFLDGPHSIQEESLIITSAEQAREVVRTHKKKGFDLLKVYDYLDRESYYGLADEARKQNIPFGGHVPWTVSATEASEAGQKSLEHGFGLIEAVSGLEDTLIKERRQALKADKFTREDRFNLLYSPGGQFRRMLNIEKKRFNFVDSLFQELAGTFRNNDTWIVPTLTMNGLLYHYKEITEHNLMNYIPGSHREKWEEALKRYQNNDYNTKLFGQIAFNMLQSLTNRLHDAGVGILAGTDCDVDLVVPGFHLHQELQYLVEAGLTPLEALQTATVNPAKYFGRESDMGTVEEGKLADLVLLDGNPLEDISNTRKIWAVMIDGNLLDREKLDEMLREIEVKSD